MLRKNSCSSMRWLTLQPGFSALLAVQVLEHQVDQLVQRIMDPRQLCIAAGKAAWMAYLDIYILDAGAPCALL